MMEEIATVDAVHSGPSRVTLEQREVMLAFMKAHPALATGRFAAPNRAKLKAKLLAEMAEGLNAIGNKCSKSSDKWYKCWQDWKSDVKKKTIKISHHAAGIESGHPCKVQLTPLEKELVFYLDPMAVTGQPVMDPLDMPQKIDRNSCPAKTEVPVALDVPVGQWLDMDDVIINTYSKSLTCLTTPPEAARLPQDVPDLSTDPAVSTVKDAYTSQGVPPPLSPSLSSASSSDLEGVSESSLRSEKIIRAALLNAEALHKQAEVQVKRLAFQEEELSRRSKLAEEEFAFKKRKVEAAERLAAAEEMKAAAALRNAEAMETMAKAVTATMQTIQCYLKR